MQPLKFNDSFADVFDNCYGTELDKQLHEELCQTRTRMVELEASHPDIIQVKTIAPVVYHFTAIAKLQTSPKVAFQLSDFCHHLTQTAKAFGNASQIVVKGLGKGVVNTFEHNIEFCKSLATHPINEVIKPLCRAGIALGKAMYCAAELSINDPESFNKKAKELILASGKYVYENPEDAIAAVVECVLPLKAPSLVRLKQVQVLVKAVQEQEALVQAIQISTKITTPIKEILSEACAAAEIGLQYGKKALNNVIKVALQQPEFTFVGDIAALRLPSECFNDFNKLSKEVAIRGEEFFGTITQKIRNIGDDILDVMERAGGHTLEKHVGQTVNELISRAMSSDIKAASSFTNKHTAINAVKENLRNNAQEIAQWLQTDSVSPKIFDFSHNFPIGRGVANGKKNVIDNLIKSKIVLKIDPTQELGFKIISAFPFVG